MYPHLVLSLETQAQAQITFGAVEEILLGANPAERGVRAGPAPMEPGPPPARTCRCRTPGSGTASCHGQTGGRCHSSTPQRGCHSPHSAAGPEGTGVS